ncbi:12979_t:CDS:2 [Gigaspora margarita]|uniref:12979_t:CDS:1 n=1 Tax=Gigaspora margarita TaxID=4874 RepID=A0ABM8VYI8_GIGMA|nr:12979_t:CDS:2 [Gigaspora margarita]
MNLLNQKNQFEIKEDSTYPSSTKIIYKECVKNKTQRSFIYNIQKEGIYPSNTVTTIKQKNINILNKRPFQEYKIPDKYAVITEWGRGKNHRIVYCQIDYIDNKPQFLIKYRVNFENIVISTKSTSQAALLYEKAIKPSSKSTISGPLVFGLQLKTVQKVRESYNKSRQVKPANQCTEMTLKKRAKQISRDAYCKLAATEQLLLREWSVFNERNNFDSEIVQKVINAIGTGVQRSAKDILLYIISKLMHKNVLQLSDPIIHLRISEDGRNSMKKLQIDFKNYPGYIRLPLFDMIPLDHFVFDILYLFLRITDRLWTLVLAEIEEKGLFNDITRQVIINEMKRLKISFDFWEEESHIWKHTSLSAMINPFTDSQQFKQQAYNWLMLFLKPSQATEHSTTNELTKDYQNRRINLEERGPCVMGQVITGDSSKQLYIRVYMGSGNNIFGEFFPNPNYYNVPLSMAQQPIPLDFYGSMKVDLLGHQFDNSSHISIWKNVFNETTRTLFEM